MHIAYDTTTGRVVVGPDVRRGGSVELVDRYRCPVCDSSLRYNDEPSGEIDYFEHRHTSCIRDGNMSSEHRLAEEIITKELLNCLPFPIKAIAVDIEGRIGNTTDFIISDVCVREPIQLAVEVIHTHKKIQSPRRLEVLAKEGYQLVYVAVNSPELPSATVGGVQTETNSVDIGRFDPQTLKVTWGQIVSPAELNRTGGPKEMSMSA